MAVVFFWPAIALQAQGPRSVEERDFENRVRDFYTLLQLRRTEQLASYATADTREFIGDHSRETFMGFLVQSVKIKPDGDTAEAEVEITVMAPMAGGPMSLIRRTLWAKEGGEWRIMLPRPVAGGLEQLMGVSSSKIAPGELKFASQQFDMKVIQPGEKKEIRFTFENPTDHTVKIESVETGCDCLTLNSEMKEFGPGESGELVLEFDSTGREYLYQQTIVVKTLPGNATSYLTVRGEVVPKHLVKQK